MSKRLKRLLVIAFWLIVWQAASIIVGNPVLLCGPVDVCVTLAALVVTPEFWQSIAMSFLRIFAGFAIAFVAGIVLGILAWRASPVRMLLEPLLSFIKSVPIVCIIVLLLIWVGSQQVSAIAVFLMVFPNVYFAMVQGLSEADVKMEQMLQVFRVPFGTRVKYFYWPQVLPYLLASSKVVVGMSWKAGIAAEVIGVPAGTIGEHIYMSKILLETASLFSWTLVIVLISLLCEKAFLAMLAKSKKWSRASALPEIGYGGINIADIAHDTGAVPTSRRFHPQSPTRISFEIKDVSKSFDDKTVLDHASITLPAGSHVCIMAPSGTGKTTLLSLLSDIEMPDSGTITGLGRVSAEFQESRLFDDESALDNVRLVASSELEAGDVADMLASVLPASSILKPAGELSGGMRRRLELIRALAAESEAVLLDEPFAGLDVNSKVLAAQAINSYLGPRTLIVATHSEKDAAMLDATIVKITESGKLQVV